MHEKYVGSNLVSTTGNFDVYEYSTIRFIPEPLNWGSANAVPAIRGNLKWRVQRG